MTALCCWPQRWYAPFSQPLHVYSIAKQQNPILCKVLKPVLIWTHTHTRSLPSLICNTNPPSPTHQTSPTSFTEKNLYKKHPPDSRHKASYREAAIEKPFSHPYLINIMVLCCSICFVYELMRETYLILLYCEITYL